MDWTTPIEVILKIIKEWWIKKHGGVLYKDEALTVYDASGVIRIKIGNIDGKYRIEAYDENGKLKIALGDIEDGCHFEIG